MRRQNDQKIAKATIMDKSLGTNLHLWRFFTRAKQTVMREFNYTCSAPPPTPPTMLDTCTRNFSRVSTLYGVGEGGETNFEKDNSAFSNSVFKTQIIHAMTQVSQGILSTIVEYSSSHFFQAYPKRYQEGSNDGYFRSEHYTSSPAEEVVEHLKGSSIKEYLHGNPSRPSRPV